MIINGDCGCTFWQPVQADLQPKSSGLVLGRRPLRAVLHSSNEPVELSQWLCRDDSTINIVLDIIIIIFYEKNYYLFIIKLFIIIIIIIIIINTDESETSTSDGRTLLKVVGVVDVKVPGANVRRRHVVRSNCGRLCLPEHYLTVTILVADMNCITTHAPSMAQTHPQHRYRYAQNAERFVSRTVSSVNFHSTFTKPGI